MIGALCKQRVLANIGMTKASFTPLKCLCAQEVINEPAGRYPGY